MSHEKNYYKNVKLTYDFESATLTQVIQAAFELESEMGFAPETITLDNKIVKYNGDDAELLRDSFITEDEYLKNHLTSEKV